MSGPRAEEAAIRTARQRASSSSKLRACGKRGLAISTEGQPRNSLVNGVVKERHCGVGTGEVKRVRASREEEEKEHRPRLRPERRLEQMGKSNSMGLAEAVEAVEEGGEGR